MPTAQATTAAGKFAVLRTALNDDLIARADAIEAVLVALLTRTHVFLLSEPGAAKSMLLDRLCLYISGVRKFQKQMNRQTTFPELFGPPKLSALKNDRYEFATDGFVPWADIVRLGEAFKGNSSVLNTLLDAVNERTFSNGATLDQIPLATVLCDSNEMPQGEELGALWDRLLQRLVVKSLTDGDQLMALLDLDPDPTPVPILDWSEVLDAQRQTAAIPVTVDAKNALIEIHQGLDRIGIRPSNRRLRESLKLAKAAAWLDGETEAQVGHLEPVANAFWENPDQASAVEKVVMQVCSPSQAEVLLLKDAISGIVDEFAEAMKIESAKDRYDPVLEVQKKVAKAQADAEKLAKKATGRAGRILEDSQRQLDSLSNRVVADGFGISLPAAR